MIFDIKLQGQAIRRLRELHARNYSLADFAVKDRKHAIYLLQGAAITSAINGQQLLGRFGMFGREWRYIAEVSYLIEYLDELEDNDRRVKAWFRGEVIKRVPVKNQIDSTLRQAQSPLGAGFFKMYDDEHRAMTNELSKFAHATMSSTLPNVYKATCRFDYDSLATRDASTFEPLRGILVSETIACFLSARRTLPLQQDHRSELLGYMELLHDRSRLSGLFDDARGLQPRRNVENG